MIRAVRRRVTVYRIYRQNRALWDSYLSVLGSTTNPIDAEAVLALDAFLQDFLSSYERLSQPKLLHRIFGESFLPAVVDTLISLIAEHGTALVNKGCIDLDVGRSREVIERALTVCSIILQDPVHSSQVAFNLPLASQILSLLEAIEDKELKTLVLQLISGLCYNHESRLEIARLDGFRKILDLLKHGDQSLSHQILRTLRVFLDAESNNQNIFEERRASLESFPDSTQSSPISPVVTVAKVSEKAGTWSRSRTCPDLEKRPLMTRSRSLVNLNLSGFVGFSTEFGIFSSRNDHDIIPAPGDINCGHSLEEAKASILQDREIISQQIQRFSDLNNSSLVSTTSIVKTMLTTQGALEQLARSLQDSQLDMQLELLRTISKLISRNHASQREFARIKGYSSITRLLLQAVRDLPDQESSVFLSECFSIIFKIIVDDDSESQITNMPAFSWLVSEVSPSSLLLHSPALVPAVNCLSDLLIANPLNAAAFIDHIPNLVASYPLSHSSARSPIMHLLYHLDVLLCSYCNAVFDGLVQLWTSSFDRDLFDCTVKLLQQRSICRSPRSNETMHLITSIGVQLSGRELSISQRYSLIPLLMLASISGELYPISFDSDPELAPSCVDLEEAMDILYTSAIGLNPESELSLYSLGFLTSVWSSWSTSNSARLGHHADNQFNNSGLRLLLRLLHVRDVNLVRVLSVISSLLVGVYGDDDISRFQREFAFTAGFQALIDVLLLHTEDSQLLQCGVFALLAAIVDCPSNKIDLECEPNLNKFLDVLVACKKDPSFEAITFNFLIEMGTESEGVIKRVPPPLPQFMSPSTIVKQTMSTIIRWRKSCLLREDCPNQNINFFEDFDHVLPDDSQDAGESCTNLQQTAVLVESMQFRFGSATPLQCLKLCVSSKTASVQASLLSAILQMVKGRPHNKRILAEIGALAFLIRSWHRFALNNADVRQSFFDLLSSLGRYSIRPSQVRLLFDLAHDAMSSGDQATELYILDLIASMASRVTPEAYFSFKLSTAAGGAFLTPTLTRTPTSRNGYSVVFWFKIAKFITEETSLFTYIQNDVPLYEVLLRLTPRPNGDNDRSVCIRSMNVGTFMFDKGETVPEKVWHHFVLTHNRTGVNIMMNSAVIGKYPAVPYPSTIIKRDSFQLAVGGKNMTGQIGNVHVLEGCLDHHQALAQCALGPSVPLAFNDMKHLLKVHAGDLADPIYRPRVSSPAVVSRALSGSSLHSDNQVSLPLNVDAHQTMSFRTALCSSETGGFIRCIPFIGEHRPGSNAARLAALRILADLIIKSPETMSEFERQNGFEMLAFCLTPAHLSMDTFHVLLQIARKNASCMPLIMDLLRHSTGPGTRVRVLGIVADMIRDESLSYFNSSAGVINLLELLSISAESDEVAAPVDPSTPTVTLLSSVLCILEQVTLTCGAIAEFDTIFAFLVCKYEHSDILFEERAAITAMFCRCAESHESLLASVSIPLIIPMLESSSTALRVQCLKLLALLFRNSPKQKSAFVKMHGFDVILRLLAKHQPVNEAICDAVFDLALDRYDHSAHINTNNGSESRAEEPSNVIVHPEAIRLLLELLRLASSRPTLHLRYIERLEELIQSRSNLNIILSEPWLHWCRQYLEGIGRFHCVERPQFGSPIHHHDSAAITDTESISTSSVLSSTRGDNVERHRARLVSRFVRLIQKIVIRDLSWHSGRASCLPKLLSMVEASEFVSLVVDRILSHFEKHPRLDESDAPCLIRNLARIIDSIDELCGTDDRSVSGKWSVRLIHVINLLASQNNIDTRTRMKQSGLFDYRDQLLLRFCQQPCSSSDRFVALSQLSLDAVASDAKFRNSDGILYLLRWFICDNDHVQLRMLLLDALRRRLGQNQDARKDLERAVGDPDVIQHLLESTVSDADFVIWFFASDRSVQREAIVTRLERSLQLAEASARKQFEKVDEKRQKRIRSRLDTLGKAAAASERAVQDMLEKSEAIVGRFSKMLSTQFDAAAEARRSRSELGASVYAKLCQNIGCIAEDRLASSKVCTLCPNSFETNWELICHLRLDHWSGGENLVTPVSTGDPSATISTS